MGHYLGRLCTVFLRGLRLCLLTVLLCGVTTAVANENGNAAFRNLGDFNGDGKDDVLLRHENGRWFYYPMDGRSHITDQRGYADLTRNLDWQFAGIGDLNGDGKDDVLVRHTDGRWFYYPMDGRYHITGERGLAGLTRNLDWHVAGIGDLNGDGKDDVLLRNKNGRWYYYPMNGRRFLADERGYADLTRDLDWQVAGMGDLNGDGKDDVLLRHTDGRWDYYPMDGRNPIADQRGLAGLTRNLDWQVAGIGDLNGDGKDDVLLRHTDSRWYYYPMDGRRFLTDARGYAGLTRNLDWQVAGIGDLNGDGRDDVLLRHTDRRWYYYPMDGRRFITDERGTADLTRNLDWSIAGAGALPPDMVNDAPVVKVNIPDIELRISQYWFHNLEAPANFEDPNGDTLSYELKSSDDSVATAQLYLLLEEPGLSLGIRPQAVGTAIITVTATDPGGLSATTSFTVTITTPVLAGPPQIYNDNLIVLSLDEVPTDSASLDVQIYARSIYEWFDDSFDYLMFFLNLPDKPQGIPFLGRYYSAWNETQGTGHSIFFDSGYGSDRKLRGALLFPFYDALLYGPSLHELLHSWANYTIPTTLGGHWGFSSANGQLGGFDLETLVDLGGGQYTTTRSFGTFANGGNSVTYSSIELYFAGLIAPEEVPDLWVAENGAWLRDENNKVVRSEYDTFVFTADFKIYPIDDIIAAHGARVPDWNNSQKHYRVAAVLLTDEDHPATLEIKQQISEHVEIFSYQGIDESEGKFLFNYYEATGGLSTITMDGLSRYRKETPVRSGTKRPTSFGIFTPPVD